ncbi:MerR family transcriptional regulator [Weissella viridescens]|uniref:MerR family transcriptional regulator n=1 Tax=Weissella viridescens TaxID=1629 RepID=UPI001746396B|nr:MerR family transcriptional regulator [Weissella viridescens]MBX4172093.1 MerR family transcriptional regulator [Weissella viridescens]MCB6839712.1 MerR family transcriptional regulator [Weissella viridescens]MCB6846444.1 MerR family transcriptional regulator [Weissella viridescens]QOD85722.1 MerR family transcriptional regulator [Weissella viridescens]WJI90836.1 MerR family transcriptional regulator [Weissella viridescens]
MTSNIITLHGAMVANQTHTAQLADVSIMTIRNWTKQGKLHPHIEGGTKLYDLDELASLIRPRNPHSRKSYLIADIPDYENFITHIVEDVAQRVKDSLLSDNVALSKEQTNTIIMDAVKKGLNA